MDAENKMLRFDDPNFHPANLGESIQWHQYALEQARHAAEAAGKALYDYKKRIVDEQQAGYRRDAENNRFRGVETVSGDVLPMAPMVILPPGDRTLQKLEEENLYTTGEVLRLERKITDLRAILEVEQARQS